MNYIYDIILNFNEKLYDFFEWKNEDNIISVRKIPVLKVENNVYISLRNNKIKISEATIDLLKKSFSLYNEKIEGNIICLVTDGKSAFGVMFDTNGNLIKRSGMLFDEENEVICESENINKVSINFDVNEFQESDNISRIVNEKREYIKDFLSGVSDDVVLKYIYYDYYEKENEKIDLKTNLLKELDNPWNNKLDKLYELTKLLASIK